MKNPLLRNTFALWALALLSYTTACAQNGPKASPADSTMGKIGSASVAIRYSSPSVKGRTVWGQLVPYNEVWRAGANEATTFQTDKDLMVEGKLLKAGKYSLFAIPTSGTWTVIFNKTAKQWGAYKYDDKQDALRVTVKPVPSPTMNERLQYSITDTGIVLRWENLEVPIAMRDGSAGTSQGSATSPGSGSNMPNKK